MLPDAYVPAGVEPPLREAVPAAYLLITGGLFAVISSLGFLWLSDFYSRMHPPTMGATLGFCCVLIASMLVMLVSSAMLHRPLLHELSTTLFVFMTAPVTAMLLVWASLLQGKACLKPPSSRG